MKKILKTVVLASTFMFGVLGLSAVSANAATAVNTVTATPKSNTIAVGRTKKLTVTVAPKKADQAVVWSSSNTKVATVTAKGVVKGVKTGSATITATSSADATKTASVKVKVVAKKLTITSKNIKNNKYKLKNAVLNTVVINNNVGKSAAVTLEACNIKKLNMQNGNSYKVVTTKKGNVKRVNIVEPKAANAGTGSTPVFNPKGTTAVGTVYIAANVDIQKEAKATIDAIIVQPTANGELQVDVANVDSDIDVQSAEQSTVNINTKNSTVNVLQVSGRAEGQKVNLVAADRDTRFGTVTIAAPKANVTLGINVQNVNVSGTSTGTQLQVSGSAQVDKVNVEAEKTVVENTGSIANMVISGKDAEVSSSTDINVETSAGGNAVVNGTAVNANETVIINPEGGKQDQGQGEVVTPPVIIPTPVPPTPTPTPEETARTAFFTEASKHTTIKSGDETIATITVSNDLAQVTIKLEKDAMMAGDVAGTTFFTTILPSLGIKNVQFTGSDTVISDFSGLNKLTLLAELQRHLSLSDSWNSDDLVGKTANFTFTAAMTGQAEFSQQVRVTFTK